MLKTIFSEEYNGHYSDILAHIPSFFDLLQKVYRYQDLDWRMRFKINCCFSYFAAPEDIFPDDNLREGYIDDLYICAYVLNDLLDENPEFIRANWEGKEIIDRLVKEVLGKTSRILGDKAKDILAMVGLIKFNEVCQNENVVCESSDITIKIERLDYNIQELTSLIKTIFIAQGKRLHIRKFGDLVKLFTDNQWQKVIKILEELEIHESKYDNQHELKLEEIKRKVLLDIDESIMADLK